MQEQRYVGKAVAITGAGSGLGAAMAAKFAAEGARVALLDIDADRAEEQAAQLRGQGFEAYADRVDVADKASVEAAAARFSDCYGGCHALCVNVGVQQFGAIDKLTEQDWQWVMSVNFHGAINSVAAFLPLLRASEGKRHVVLTSSAGFFQIGARMAAYIASKYALTGYGEVLRRELAPEGINVALLFPAGMETRHMESSIAARPAELGPSRFEMEDIQVMMEDAQINLEGHVVSPLHAIRNLIDDLDAGHPYIVTHGTYRPQVEARQRAMLDAFDRMAARP